MTKNYTYYVIEKDGKYLGPNVDWDDWFEAPNNAKMFENRELAWSFAYFRQANIRTVTLEVK